VAGHADVPQSGFGRGVITLIERACVEPELLRQLKADPVGTAYAAGLRPTAADLKRLLGIVGATDDELLQVLIARVLLKF
jgi:hypothetical protein